MQTAIKKKSKKRMGRPKKTGGRKITLWMSDLNREMLRLYAERNCTDMTTALNQMLQQHLSAIGLAPEAQEVVDRNNAKTTKKKA